MKVLVSAYACLPDHGSEEEVGLQAVLALLDAHDVWVLTRPGNLAPLRERLSGHPRREHLHLEPVEEHAGWARLDRTGRLGVWGSYDAWQRRAARRAVALHAAVGFDVVHHVTYASYWVRAGVADVDAPFLLGPVGGGVEPPLGLLGVLGPAGLAEDALRVATRRVLSRALFGSRTLRSADLVLVQNDETGRAVAGRIGASAVVRKLPNATAVDLADVAASTGRSSTEVVAVGRLIPWKAAVLAVRALAHVAHDDARLVFFGDGPQRRRVQRLAARLGVAERVELGGGLRRPALLRRVADAAALLHCAVHDESPLTVAEALSLGTPVVALDGGGPRELVRWWPDAPATLVAPSTPGVTARRLAAALDTALDVGAPASSGPKAPRGGFAPGLRAAVELLAHSGAASNRGPGRQDQSGAR